MRSADSSMSSMRTFQSLGGTDGLLEYPVADPCFQSVGGDQVNRTSEDGLQVLLQVKETEEAHRPVQLHKDVHVRILAGLIASDGAEDGDGAGAVGGDLLFVLGQDA